MRSIATSLAAFLAACLVVPACAQQAPANALPYSAAPYITLPSHAGASLLSIPIVGAQPPPTTVNPTTYVSLRAGAMLSPRVAADVGLDVDIPGLSIGSGWHGRADLDVLIKTGFLNADTAVPVTLDEIYYAPRAIGGYSVYAGFGIGAIFASNTQVIGKLLVGVPLLRRLDAEANLDISGNDTLFTIFARIHL